MYIFAWGPDWNDPVLQELYIALTTETHFSWINVTSINDILGSLAFNSNQTALIQGIARIYNITYSLAPYIWIPNFGNYVLVQPYLQGFVYSPYVTPFGDYWYNTLYYSSR